MADDTLICRCYRVKEAEIRQAIADGKLTTVEQVTEASGAAGGCGSCFEDVQGIVDSMNGTARRAAPKAAVPAGPEVRIKILDALRNDVIPLLDLNGVKVDVLGIESDRVLARFNGRDVGTTNPANLTLKWFMVRMMSAAAGRKMSLIETNILEEMGDLPAPPKHPVDREGGPNDT